MVEYRIVKYCGKCKARFLVNRGEAKRRYCNDCEKEVAKQKEKFEKEKAQEKAEN
jgi:hypothetical protein